MGNTVDFGDFKTLGELFYSIEGTTISIWWYIDCINQILVFRLLEFENIYALTILFPLFIVASDQDRKKQCRLCLTVTLIISLVVICLILILCLLLINNRTSVNKAILPNITNQTLAKLTSELKHELSNFTWVNETEPASLFTDTPENGVPDNPDYETPPVDPIVTNSNSQSLTPSVLLSTTSDQLSRTRTIVYSIKSMTSDPLRSASTPNPQSDAKKPNTNPVSGFRIDSTSKKIGTPNNHFTSEIVVSQTVPGHSVNLTAKQMVVEDNITISAFCKHYDIINTPSIGAWYIDLTRSVWNWYASRCIIGILEYICLLRHWFSGLRLISILGIITTANIITTGKHLSIPHSHNLWQMGRQYHNWWDQHPQRHPGQFHWYQHQQLLQHHHLYQLHQLHHRWQV